MSGVVYRLSGSRKPFMYRNYPYHVYEMAHAVLAPARAVSDATHFVFRNPWNPLSNTPFGKNISAGAELFERMTRRYGKPTFGLDEFELDGVVYPVLEDVVWSRPYCNLLHFVRPESSGRGRPAEAHDRCPDVGPLRDATARNGRGVPAPLRRLHHRLGGRADGPARGRNLRSRRLHRLSARNASPRGPRRAHARRLPAFGAAPCGSRADGGERRGRRAGQHDPDGRARRHAAEPDRGQQARREARGRMVPAQLPANRPVPLSGLRSGSLSGLPSAFRLHGDESSTATSTRTSTCSSIW